MREFTVIQRAESTGKIMAMWIYILCMLSYGGRRFAHSVETSWSCASAGFNPKLEHAHLKC